MHTLCNLDLASERGAQAPDKPHHPLRSPAARLIAVHVALALSALLQHSRACSSGARQVCNHPPSYSPPTAKLRVLRRARACSSGTRRLSSSTASEVKPVMAWKSSARNYPFSMSAPRRCRTRDWHAGARQQGVAEADMQGGLLQSTRHRRQRGQALNRQPPLVPVPRALRQRTHTAHAQSRDKHMRTAGWSVMRGAAPALLEARALTDFTQSGQGTLGDSAARAAPAPGVRAANYQLCYPTIFSYKKKDENKEPASAECCTARACGWHRAHPR